MTKQAFHEALEKSEPSPSFTAHQQALWWIQHDMWDAAHELIQTLDDPKSSLIHGYLHELEGDLSNANYWYRRSGISVPDKSKWLFLIDQVMASIRSDHE